MILNTPKAPEGYSSALQKEVRQFIDDARTADLLSSAKVGLRIVSVSLDDLRKDDALKPTRKSDKPAAWRFLAKNEGNMVAGEVSGASNGQPHLVNFSTDPRIVTALQLLEGLSHFKELGDATYDVSLVRVNGVLVEALYIHSPNKQYAIPVLSASKQLRIGDLYEAGEFLQILRELAVQFRKQEMPRYKPDGPKKPKTKA
jgi:hypothetical protein